MIPFAAALPYLLVAQAVATAYSVYAQSQANKAAAEYQAAIQENNAKIARWQAEDAMERGLREEAAKRLQTARMLASQRATMAARGLDLDEGSPFDVLVGTAYIGELDALTIRDNAAKEAWAIRERGKGFTSEAELYRMKAANEKPLFSAAGSLLTSATEVALLKQQGVF